MSKMILKVSTLALALVFTTATIDVAEAGGTARKQARGASGQMMRLGGPATAQANTSASNPSINDNTTGVSLRTNAEIQRFFERQRDERGPG
jgi:hypothetical protein